MLMQKCCVLTTATRVDVPDCTQTSGLQIGMSAHFIPEHLAVTTACASFNDVIHKIVCIGLRLFGDCMHEKHQRSTDACAYANDILQCYMHTNKNTMHLNLPMQGFRLH